MPLGKSFNFDIACSFAGGRSNGDILSNSATLTAEGETEVVAIADDVTLTLVENFRMFKSILEGNTVDTGEIITIRLLLSNTGDSGATISNAVISDALPNYLTAVDGDVPIGREFIVDQYSDPTYNELTGSWDGNTMNFTLPSYSGSAYAIFFQAKVDELAPAGEKIVNTGTWTVDGVDRNNAVKTITVFEEKAESLLTKNAPNYGTVGNDIQYRILARNTGTVTLNNYTITDTLPDEVNLKSVSFAPDTTAISSYSIEVETSDNVGVYTPVVSDLTSRSGAVDLTSFIPDGERVVSVRVVAPTALVSLRNNIFMLLGTISEDAEVDSTITNSANISATTENIGDYSISKTKNTILNGVSTLNISKEIRPVQSAYYPLNEFLVAQTINANTSFLTAPIITDLLPLGISYATGNHYFTYYDALANITYDSRNENFPISTPEPQVITDYEGTGRTLVRFFFKDLVLQYRNILTANFTAIVDIKSEKSFLNYSYVGNPSDSSVVDSNSYEYTDDLDLDGDGIYEETIAQSEGVGGVILTTSLFSIEKWVKGDLESGYDKSSFVTPGGDVIYKLCITNNQEDTLKNIELVDILPHVDDTGVILYNTPRESQFPVYATSVVDVQVMNIVTGEIIETLDITTEYSDSYNPIRFNASNTGTIGDGTWSDTPPIDVTNISAIKVTTGETFTLNSYERLLVTIYAKAPVGAEVGDVAYNSFAVKADRVSFEDGSVATMLPVEPPKVWVQVEENPLGSIGEFVWEDYNEDGVFDDNEVGLNGVTVVLLNSEKEEIHRTITSDDASGNAGYYEFNNLETGDYYVQFIPVEGFELTVQKEDIENGSTPDQTTGLTNVITLTDDEMIVNINAGVVGTSCGEPTIYAENQCIELDSTFEPLENVTAKDCLEEDLTSSIVVESNDVDTSVAGTYTVVYSVTDSRGQTATKTIYVGVYSDNAREQALTDVIESVALEETAISHILNAEYEKIDKIKNMEGITYDQILEANKSVEDMVNSITSLELILMQKLETVKTNSSYTDHCDFPTE